MNNIQFPANQIHPNWYNYCTILYLEITDQKISHIQPNAFASRYFERLKNLTLIDMPIEVLNNGIFNGLKNLCWLQLIGLKLKTIENGLFNETSRIGDIVIGNSLTPVTTVNNFFSSFANSEMIPPITTLLYKDNDLADIMTKKMFGNLKLLEHLLLARNKIIAIARDAFEIVGENLKYINLNDNLLKSLPEGIFDPLFVGKEEIIARKRAFLDSNPWVCSCDLVWLRTLLLKRPLFTLSSIYCRRPNSSHELSILSADIYCSITDSTATILTTLPLTSTASSALTTLSPTTTVASMSTASTYNNSSPPESSTVVIATAQPSQSNVMFLSCPTGNSSYATELLRDDKILNITANTNGDIEITVRSFSKNHILVWYENDFSRDIRIENIIKCQGSNATAAAGSEIHTIRLTTKLNETKIYIFCMAKKEKLLISPLNCVAFHHSATIHETNREQHPWLAPAKRIRVIAAIVIVYIFTVLIGILVLHVMIRKCRKIYKTKHMVTVVHNQMDLVCHATTT